MLLDRLSLWLSGPRLPFMLVGATIGVLSLPLLVSLIHSITVPAALDDGQYAMDLFFRVVPMGTVLGAAGGVVSSYLLHGAWRSAGRACLMVGLPIGLVAVAFVGEARGYLHAPGTDWTDRLAGYRVLMPMALVPLAGAASLMLLGLGLLIADTRSRRRDTSPTP